MDNTQTIQEKLDKMLGDPKAKGFLTHLIKAYFPTTNVVKVLDKPNGPFKCSISNTPLVSVNEIIKGIFSETFMNDFNAFMLNMFDEKTDKTSPIATLIGERKLGLTGKDTTTFLSYTAFQELHMWLVSKSLKGDKFINWLLSDIRRKSEGLSNDIPSKKRYKKEEDIDMTAKYQLGDHPVFKALKEKFDNEVHSS